MLIGCKKKIMNFVNRPREKIVKFVDWPKKERGCAINRFVAGRKKNQEIYQSVARKKYKIRLSNAIKKTSQNLPVGHV